MIIAEFTDTFSQQNGLAKHVQYLSAALAERGNDVTVYTGSGESTGNYKVVNLSHFKFPLAPEYEYISVHRMGIEADVCHAHSPFCTAKLAFRSGLPVVTTTHTLPIHMLGYLHLNFLQSAGWKYLIRFHNKSDHVICQTRATEELFRKHGLKKPTSIIPIGIDLSKFKNGNGKRFIEKYKLPNEFVFSTSRLSAEKNPHVIAQACRELNIPCVFISTGPLLEKMRKKFPEHFFLGFIPEQDKFDGYSAATVFALASGAETEGIVVSEAMASGAPVIASNIPVIADNVVDGVNGYLAGTYAEFKQKLDHLWQSADVRARFAEEGKKSVEEKDMGIVAEKIIEVYEKLVKK